MNRSIWTGLNGVVGNQTYLDVLSDNVANLDTPGFRRSSPKFDALLSQTIQSGTGGQGNVGGTNPVQIGLGSYVNAIDAIHTQGPLEATERPGDLAISGNGFFPLSLDGEQVYSRAGRFVPDAEGHFVLSGTGAMLQGIPQNGNGQGNLEPIRLPIATEEGQTAAGNTMDPSATTSVLFSCNLSRSMNPEESHSTTIDIYDAAGDPHTLQVTWSKALDEDGQWRENRWQWTAELAEDPGGTVGEGEIAFYGEESDAGTPGAVVDDASATPAIDIAFPGSEGASTVTLDFTGGGDDLEGLTQYDSPSTTRAVSQNGYPEGEYHTFSFDTAGHLNAHYTNGQSVALYRVPLALFRNPTGLDKQSDTLFMESLNSGDVRTTFSEEGGAGLINPQALEQSNVTLSESFSNVIVAQRSYQANARVLTTSDAFLDESIRMKG
ncbi:MAG: flagellar hook protein FlgE [Synergistales bacterium]|nr:flagellar hook protein FlgE [Synergistales bacterium]